MLGTAIILLLIGVVIVTVTRMTVWLIWNLQIVASLRQKTTIKLIGLALALLFLCPGMGLLVATILDIGALVRFP